MNPKNLIITVSYTPCPWTIIGSKQAFPESDQCQAWQQHLLYPEATMDSGVRIEQGKAPSTGSG